MGHYTTKNPVCSKSLSLSLNNHQVQHKLPINIHLVFRDSSSHQIQNRMAYLQKISCIGVFLLMALVCEASSPVSSGFIQTRNSHFLLNGSPFLFNGFNSYWVMHVAVEPSERYKVTNVFREASAAGLKVCRTWAFSDGGYQALQTSPGVYGERVFQVILLISGGHVYPLRLYV